jgi:hypothetical protein
MPRKAKKATEAPESVEDEITLEEIHIEPEVDVSEQEVPISVPVGFIDVVNAALADGAELFFDGAHVRKILHDGREVSTNGVLYYHCSMTDGTTKHVPEDLLKVVL